MTPERLQFCLDSCLAHRSNRNVSAHHRDIARFLHITERTLRRWLSGAQPIPRMAEIIFELFHAKPDINAGMVEQLLANRDEI